MRSWFKQISKKINGEGRAMPVMGKTDALKQELCAAKLL